MVTAVAVSCVLLGCSAGSRAHLAAGPTAVAPRGSDERLARLARERRGSKSEADYVLGQGDLISIKAYDLAEMDQRVRVAGDGTITLPLLNTVPVADRTLSEVQRDLTKRLGAFMYDPHVTVFIEEYRSQQVAVEGAVNRPGLVSQTVPNATVRDVISAAGGPTPEAGTRIFLIPADASLGAAAANGVGGDERLTSGIMVDTAESDEQTKSAFFSLPVRSGDVLVVPGAGKFIADGWVAKPGTYPLTKGLTLRGALATAGGLTFPAESDRIAIYRPGEDGLVGVREVNFSDIEAMRAPDVFIHDGDVIKVASSKAKLVPYGAYKIITDLVKVGAGIRVVP
jgi:polysaccharide export outer membrane protein